MIFEKFLFEPYNVHGHSKDFHKFLDVSDTLHRSYTQARNQGGSFGAFPPSRHCIAVLIFVETFKE